MSLEHLIKILQDGTLYLSGAWVLVMGDLNGQWVSLQKGLKILDVDVRHAETFDQARELIKNSELPPLLAYLYADELGGLDKTIVLHSKLQKQAHISKCLIVSTEADESLNMRQSSEISPLILAAPKRRGLN